MRPLVVLSSPASSESLRIPGKSSEVINNSNLSSNSPLTALVRTLNIKLSTALNLPRI